MRFFNSIYDDKLVTFGASPIKHILKKIYFRNMYLFLEYARDVATIKNNKLVRTNL